MTVEEVCLQAWKVPCRTYATQAFAPKLNAVPISTAALFLLVWYLLIGVKLLRLGRAA
jgi:hypothetical protein